MRLGSGDPATIEYCKWLNQLNTTLIGQTSLPEEVWRTTAFEAFVQRIYPTEVMNNFPPRSFFRGRAIRCSTNRDALAVNDLLLDQMTGEKEVFFSNDELPISKSVIAPRNPTSLVGAPTPQC